MATIKSIEEKAEAYDKVREKIALRFGSNVAEEIFSEYEESEDERIRKELLNYLYDVHDDDEERARWIAWLENQGEHAKFRDSIQVGDKVTRNRDGMLVNLSQLKRVAKPAENKGEHDMGISEATKQELEDNLHKALEKETPESCHEFLNEQDELDKESEDEKIRQFLIHEVEETSDKVMSYRNMNKKAVLAWLEKQGEQKPAWSEEDDNCLSTIIAEFSKYAGKSVSKDEWMRCNNFLNSLRDRVQLQPQQEWSEEDERVLCKCLGALGNPNYCYEDRDLEHMRNWLKSLRPHNTWKPSVEEVVALEHAINCYSGISPTNANEVFILEIMKERLKNLTK